MTILSDINPIVDVLKNLSERGIKCNLLVGAGCSVTANIPTANGIVEIIKEKFPSIYSMVEEKSYANCMNALSPDERNDLIKNLVSNSKLNITHIIIAELLKRGYIHRILTPNFDNLLIKACSMVDEYPPIYDLATYEEFKPEHIPEKCIFYLHGQFTGFKLMNTNEEVKKQAEKLESLFHRLNERSVWIVVGYSGLNDALFRLLSDEGVYSNRLFWIGYNNEEPHSELKTKVLRKEKYGFYVKSFDSDGFFWRLANNLGTLPPHFLLRPFTYIKNKIDQIVPYRPSENLDLSAATNNIIQSAINKYEKDPALIADCYYNWGLFDSVIDMKDVLLKKKKSTIVANSYFYKALQIQKEAETKRTVELYEAAIENYNHSHKINNYHGNSNNIGICYHGLASLVEEKCDEYVFKSCENYLLAIKAGDKNLAYGNIINSFKTYMKKHSKNGKVIDQIYENFKKNSELNLFKKLNIWINDVKSNLEKIKISNEIIINYLTEFQDLVES